MAIPMRIKVEDGTASPFGVYAVSVVMRVRGVGRSIEGMPVYATQEDSGLSVRRVSAERAEVTR